MSKAVEAQEQRGDGSADDSGGRGSGDEEGEGAGAVRGREPAREAKDDAREESGLGYSQEETEEIEAGRGMDERHRRGDDSPGDHDDGDPAARAKAEQDQVSRNFKESVADEEEACSGSVDCSGKSQIASHGECSEAEVNAIEIGADVEQEEKRDESPEDAADKTGRVNVGRVLRLRHAALDNTASSARRQSRRLLQDCS